MLTIISDLCGIVMGFVNLPNPAFVLIVHRFGEPFLSGMCIVLVHEKVSVVLVAHKKSTPSINEWCKPSTTCTQNEYLAPLIVNSMFVLCPSLDILKTGAIAYADLFVCFTQF